VIAGVVVAVELAVSARYGFQQDELYFLVAGHHLAFGYVDQPPLIPLLTRITDIIGVSPTAVRVIPALTGGAVVAAAARLAALFGAGRLGRVLAALTTACAPVIIGAAHIGNTTPLDLLAWTAVLLCVSTALLRDRPRWWLGAGAAAGAGFENNNLMLLLLAGLAVGILVAGRRRVRGTRWPWLGAGIAALIWAPNIIWQATHGWPQLAMASALHHENSSPAEYAGGLPRSFTWDCSSHPCSSRASSGCGGPLSCGSSPSPSRSSPSTCWPGCRAAGRVHRDGGAGARGRTPDPAEPTGNRTGR
jgi:4-amino-4-deoxy-L-arabinose transferase-like glycosyltransferase